MTWHSTIPRMMVKLVSCLWAPAVAVQLAALSAAEPAPLRQAHAHNDFAHERPLLDALDHGFCSVEADIFLRSEGLLVGHDAKELKPDRTLEKLYLDPLRERVRAGGGSIYRGGPPFHLLIDVKTDANETYTALDKVLAQYADILSITRDGKFERRAVTVVLSGNRAIEIIKQQPVRYVGIDGRSEDLPSPAPADLIPWISANGSLQFQWRGDGSLSPDDKRKLAEFVRQAHACGRLVRFWATPEKQITWKELLSAGVDLINTDKLDELQRFLRVAPQEATRND